MTIILAMLLVVAAPGQQSVSDAVMDGDAKAVAAAIARGGDVNEQDADGITPLMRAASAGRVDILRLLLASKADVNARNAGASALTAAAFGGYAEAVQLLLANRADVNVTDQQGRTPLMAAALNGHIDVVRALLAKGADAGAADQGGGNSVTYASANGHGEILDALLTAGAKWGDEDLVVAAQGCHTGTVQSLAKMGAKVNAFRNGQSALFMAVSGHCAETAKVLIAAGADVNAKTTEGRTALMQAAGDGHSDLIQLLMDHGADMELTDQAGRSAWMYAAMGNHLEVAEIFKKARAARQSPVESGFSRTTIEVSSPTIVANQPIPRDHTADGRNISPALKWTNLPAGTRELAVICEDPDAGNPPPFVHWVIYKIPATATGLPENIPFQPGAPMPSEIAGAVQGTSGFRRPIYRGPAPPPGKVHHYHFIVYAIDASLDLAPGLTHLELLDAIKGHVIGQGELVATYQR